MEGETLAERIASTQAQGGTELYYTPGPGAVLIAVALTLSPGFTIGEPRRLHRQFANRPPERRRTSA